MADTLLIFSVVAGIMLAGFAGEQLFRRTGIPVFVFLIALGILLGPVLGVFPRQALLPTLSVFAELTLLMVLFYGGMDTSFEAAIRGGGRAFLQVVVYVVGSTFAIGAASSLLLGWSPIEALIFGSMVGGETTAAVVIPLSRSLALKEDTVAFLTLESAMNSIFSIVLFFTFVGVFETGAVSLLSAVSSIAANFSVGILVGLALAVVWILVLERYREQNYTYVLTLGLLFVTYVASSRLGGSGELSVLIFGILLGNFRLIDYLIKREVNMSFLRRRLSAIQDEVSFLMSTLFFVFLGLTFELNSSQVVTNLEVGTMVLCVLLAFRFVATKASTRGSELSSDQRVIMLMCAQGLVPATLAIIAVNRGIPLANTFLNIVTYVIVLTNVVSAGGAIWRMRRENQSLGDFRERLNKEY